MAFTRALREEIIRDFAERHDGIYNPETFVDEVRAAGKSHPAYDWFQWNRNKAARQYWIWQAREFAIGLQVRFSMEETRGGVVTVREIEGPLAMSPTSDRWSDSSGYVILDQDNPEHMAELCNQGATDLERWLVRYEMAIVYAEGSVAAIRKQVLVLRSKTPLAEAAE